MTPGGVASKIWPQTSWACPPCQLSTWYLKAWRKRIAGQLWRSASILELPKMTPRWSLTPKSWTPVLFTPPPPTWWSLYRNITKNPSRHIREEAFYDFGHTDRCRHAINSLNSLFPPLPYPLLNFAAGATTVTTYLLIENYTFYSKTYISHLPYTLHHYKPHELGCFESFTLHHCTKTQISKQ